MKPKYQTFGRHRRGGLYSIPLAELAKVTGKQPEASSLSIIVDCDRTPTATPASAARFALSLIDQRALLHIFAVSSRMISASRETPGPAASGSVKMR